MAARNAGLDMDARLDDGLAPPLTSQARLDGRQNLVIGQLEFFDVQSVQIGDVDRRQGEFPGLKPLGDMSIQIGAGLKVNPRIEDE